MIILVDAFVECPLAPFLTEGKSLATLKTTDTLRQSVIDSGFDIASGKFKKARRLASKVGNRQFDEVFKRTKRTLLRYTTDFLSWKSAKSSGDEDRILSAPRMNKTRWLENVKRILRDAYMEAFEAGFTASGVTRKGVAKPVRVQVSRADREWVKSAFAHEMRYFTPLLREIEQGTQRGSLERRLGAYAETLKHVFYAGKIMGTPSGMVIDWISPLDRNTCNGCRFLAEHSPYTKSTLPATPRSGATKCINRCRCRIVVRDVGKERFAQVERSHQSKDWYQRKLAALKAGKVLS